MSRNQHPENWKLPRNWRKTIEKETQRQGGYMKRHGDRFAERPIPTNVEPFRIPDKTIKSIRRLAAMTRKDDIVQRVGAAIDSIVSWGGIEGGALKNMLASVEYSLALGEMFVALEKREARENAETARSFDTMYMSETTDAMLTPGAFSKDESVEPADGMSAFYHLVQKICIEAATEHVDNLINRNAWAGSVLVWLTTKFRERLDRDPDNQGEGFTVFTIREMADQFGITCQAARDIMHGKDGKSGVVNYLTRESVKMKNNCGTFPLCWFWNVKQMEEDGRLRDEMKRRADGSEMLCFRTPSEYNPYVRKAFRVNIPGAWWRLGAKARALAFSLAFQWSRNDGRKLNLIETKKSGHLPPGKLKVHNIIDRFASESQTAEGHTGDARYREDVFLMQPIEKIIRDMAESCGSDAWYTLEGSDERHELGSLTADEWHERAMLVFDRSAFPVNLAKIDSQLAEIEREDLAQKISDKVKRKRIPRK